jgi:co-chaperonin GroES (HSP10)
MRVTNENRKKRGAGVSGKFSGGFPLLVKESKRWGFEVPTFQPRGSHVVVWRLPPLTETPSGLMIPEDHQSPHVKGILIAAGPKAMDSFESEGITLGHTVIFKRFAGWEANDQTPEAMRGMKILMIDASDVIGSDNLRDDLESGRAKYIKGENGRHNLSVRQISDKKAKVLKLAADPAASPAERETAKTLASRMA